MNADIQEKIKEIVRRKEEHINISINKPVHARETSTLFECVRFLNEALPEMNFEEIDTATTFLGHKFSAPLMVGAMTGGAPLAKIVNENIAMAVEELGLGMVVGSQRASLYNKTLEETYAIVRENAPNAFIGSNVGGAQLSKGLGSEEFKQIMSMLDADAFYLHLNPLQEIVQPEGEPNFKNVISRIREVVKTVKKPVVVKEVGCGISGKTARELEHIGVKAVEVAGAGGTSYAAVEYYRALDQKMRLKTEIGELFWDWGIPTALAVALVKRSVKIPVVASGGIRNGQDIAKAIALGSTLCASAMPLLKPAMISSDKVKEKLEIMIYGLKVTMFLTGCKSIKELSKVQHVITGELAELLDALQ